MPNKPKSSKSRRFIALWFVILTLGSLYTVVQFGASVLHSLPPRLSYETFSPPTTGVVLTQGRALQQTVSFTFLLSNDGLQDSDAVSASVTMLYGGWISGLFIVDYQNGLCPVLSDSHTYDSDYFLITGATTPIIPPGTSFGFIDASHFYVNVNNLPRLSYISLTFNVHVVPSIYYATVAAANVTAVSVFDYPIVEYTPSFELQSEVMRFFSAAYLTVFLVAVGLGLMAMDEDSTIGRWAAKLQP